jgi:predicted transcriptional regulator
MAEAQEFDPFVNTEEVEIDAETATALDEAVRAADEGRVVPSEEVPKLMKQWLSKFATQTRR